jgi:hypothetical protein
LKITMRPAGRYTGNSHKIVDEKLKESSVKLNDNGSAMLSVSVGPIQTSGSFRGTIEIPLSELYYLIGLIEEMKLKLLREHEVERQEAKKKATT